MSAPVRIERSAWTDGRFGTLARLIGVDRYSAIGRVAALWAEATERHTDRLSPALIAGVLECDPSEVARFMEAAELGEEADGGLIRLRGSKGRLEWLGERRAAGSRGGSKSAEVRVARRLLEKTHTGGPKKDEKGKQAASKPEANANPPGYRLQSTDQKESVRLAPDDPPSVGICPVEPTPAPAPKLGSKAPAEAASWVEWFNRRFGRSFEARTPLVENIRQLLRRGYTQEDMRMVALHRQEIWGPDEKMRLHLVPSTLLRPSNFEKYIDPAREFFAIPNRSNDGTQQEPNLGTPPHHV